MPPHNGHVFLCDFARNYADHLTILVCSLPDDPVDGKLRFDWMRELFPDCRVIHFSEVVPQEPSDHPEFWSIWRSIVRSAHPEPLDFVFASDAYGARLASEMDARFVPVDPLRQAVNISGTSVRANPYRHWHHLPAPVRAYFAQTVCVVGPESTGKSALVRNLASRFKTVGLAEYGRTHTDTFGTAVSAEDLCRIVRGHRSAEFAAKRNANRILVSDTDPLMTCVWADMLLGQRPECLLDTGPIADYYLLMDVDVPWVDDGTRYFPAHEDRSRFMSLCRAELERRGADYVLVRGDWQVRFEESVSAILTRFPWLEGG